MGGRPVFPISLKPDERSVLERRVASASPEKVVRENIILLRATGYSQAQVAQTLNCSPRTVARICSRFRKTGMKVFATPHPERANGVSKRLQSREDMHSRRSQTSLGAPTMRLVAALAGVSVATVSRALRNHPSVHPDTSRHVWAVATRAGYKPDPGLRQLMVRLRKHKVTRLQGTICSIQARAWAFARSQHYFGRLIDSARSRAVELGFSWETLAYEDLIARPSRFEKILRNRNIEGILIPPLPLLLQHQQLPEQLDWSAFSVIVATYSIREPPFRRVVPDYFRNLTIVCECLARQGYRKIGLLISQELETRTNYHLSGAFLAFHQRSGVVPMPPLFYPYQVDELCLRNWILDHQPDAVIVDTPCAARRIAAAAGIPLDGPVKIAAISCSGHEVAGIDECPEKIGAISSELLSNMIARSERGVPTNPTATMVEGVWQDQNVVLSSARA